MPLVKKDVKQNAEPTALLGYISRSLVISIAFGIVFLGAIGVAIYFYLQYQQAQAQLTQSTQANEQAVLLDEVGKLILLPTDEQPAIATVSDINKLRGQTFFSHARNGDKVIIYSKAQEAILFDPFADKIVSVGPVSLTQQASSSASTVPAPAPVKVALYNGTSVVGLTGVIAQELKTKMPDITVVARENAQKATYQSTIIVDLTGKIASRASDLAKVLGGKVGSLPVGEKEAKGADLLVILGK